MHLRLYAGPKALRMLHERGLQADDIDAVYAAAGGPKWLILYGLDEAIFELLAQRQPRPLHLLGASSGAWRMSCYAQAQPLQALQRLDEAYTHQCYPPKPSLRLVTQTCARILENCLGPAQGDDILRNPTHCLNILTARCRGPLARDLKPVLLTGLVTVALANMCARQTLGWWMERVVYHSGPSTLTPLCTLPTRLVPLQAENLGQALLATGSIPLLAEGIHLAPLGCHRDGALLDYHPSFHYGEGEGEGKGLILYPHFARQLMEGWFDRLAPWRKPALKNLERVLLLAPSPEFVARLPYGKIPDRDDFYKLSDGERIRAWNQARNASRALGDEFRTLVASGRIAQACRPLSDLTRTTSR